MNSIFRLTGRDIELIAKKKRKLCALSAAAALLAAACAATALSVGDAASESGETVDLSAYRYEYSPAEAENGRKTFDVKITADGETRTVSASGTAADALAQAGIEVGKYDLINVALTEPLNDHTDIVVQRVVYYKRTKVKKLKYATEYRDDTDIPEGEHRVISDGEKGEMVIKSIVKTVDGEEVASNIISREVTAEPVDRVVARGTGKSDSDADANVSADGADIASDADNTADKAETVTANKTAKTTKKKKTVSVSAETESAAEENVSAESYDDTGDFEDVGVIYSGDDTGEDDGEDDTWDFDEDYDDWDYDEDYDEYPEEDDLSDDDFGDIPESNVYTVPAPANYGDPGAYTYSSQVYCVSQLTPESDIALDENGVPMHYINSLHGKSCAYTANSGALMSTGLTVDQGYVAVNPSIIPYGSKLYIIADDGEVYGYAIAADTGGSVGRNDILVDLFMWSYDDCIQWGAKNVTIYVLE